MRHTDCPQSPQTCLHVLDLHISGITPYGLICLANVIQRFDIAGDSSMLLPDQHFVPLRCRAALPGRPCPRLPVRSPTAGPARVLCARPHRRERGLPFLRGRCPGVARLECMAGVLLTFSGPGKLSPQSGRATLHPHVLRFLQHWVRAAGPS